MTILVYASLEAQVAFLNHFPLFATLLRIKDPERLPGGIKWTFKDDKRAGGLYLQVSDVSRNLPTAASSDG